MIGLTIVVLTVLVAGIAVGVLVTIDHHEEARAQLDADEQWLLANWATLIARSAAPHRRGNTSAAPSHELRAASDDDDAWAA